MLFENQLFTATQDKDKDNFALEIGPEQRPAIIRNCIIDGANGDWGLKSSKSFDVIVEDCIIKNGLERALDMVRGGNIIFRRCKFINTNIRKRVTSKWSLDKECDIGLKAGIRDVKFEDCEMNDLLLGDYSIYDQIDRPRVRRISLVNCKNPNSGPIIIRGRYTISNPIICENSEIDVLIWPKFITGIYWWYNRYFGDRRPLNEEQSTITDEEKI